MKKVMFICTGNICRSAMAHWLMEKKLKDLNRNDIEVYSSGVYAENGEVSTYNAIEVMKDYDVDLKIHRATNVKDSAIEEMDLVLCATISHKVTLLQMYPTLEGKIYTMKEYVKEGKETQLDISDPWGYDIETYRFCAQEINQCLNKLANCKSEFQKKK